MYFKGIYKEGVCILYFQGIYDKELHVYVTTCNFKGINENVEIQE